MELKVGMYVRTKDKKDRQFIRKIVDLPKDARYGSIVVDKDIHNVEWVSTKNVLNASYNLIDLIEIGDYVNGLRINSITEVDENHDVRLVWNLTTYGDDDIAFSNEEIKSIVTKEQFESMKYEVK